MYEFPPPIWTNQNWSIWRLALIIVFGIVLPLRAAKWSNAKPWMVTGWVVFGAVSLCFFGNYFQYGGTTYDPYRYMIALPGSLILISAVTAVRMWWQSTDGKPRVHEGIAISVILLVLVALTLPGISTPIGASRRTQCKNNLKQLGLAMHNYHDVWSSFPAAGLGQPPVSWRISLLPFVEQSELAKRYDRNQSWDSASNADLQKVRALPYACPARPSQVDSGGRFLTSYVVPTDSGAIFFSKGGTPLSQIKDGTSNTLLVMEACGSEIIWTDPRDIDSSQLQISVNGPGNTKGRSESIISSWHFGGAQVALADGSVRFMSSNVDPKLLKALMTANGKEELADW